MQIETPLNLTLQNDLALTCSIEVKSSPGEEEQWHETLKLRLNFHSIIWELLVKARLHGQKKVTCLAGGIELIREHN